MQKEYGKLSGDQLRQLVALLPELDRLAREFREDARTSDKVRAAVKEDGVWWAPLYELPFEQHLAISLKGLGLDVHLLEAARSADPPGQVLSWAMDNSFVDRV